jgi:hypothetical protein
MPLPAVYPVDPFVFPAGLVVVFCGLIGLYRYRRNARTGKWACHLILVAGVIVIVGAFFPPRTRIPRAFYYGKDQLEWARLARSPDAETRQGAITSLCEILRARPQDPFIRMSAFHGLAEGKAQEAIPFLLELVQDADPAFGNEARETIERIDPTLVPTLQSPN